MRTPARQTWWARLGPLDRRIAALALPALGALAVEPLYNLSDTAIVGHLGRVPLGGLAVATTVLNTLAYACGFLSMATAPRVAFLRGRGRGADGARVAAAAYQAAALIGVVLAVGVVLAAPLLARWLGGRNDVAAAAVTYLRWAAAGLPFLLLMFAGTGHLRGLADTRTPFLIALGSNAVNLVLEVVLVYGAGLGLAGSAGGTVVAQVGAAAAFLAVSGRRSGPREGRVARSVDWGEVRVLLRSGAVLMVRTLALLAALTASTAVAARLGTGRLGGHQIGLQVWYLVALSLDALAVPAQILVGEALGASDPAGAARVARRVLVAGVAIGAALGLVTAATAPWLPALFSADRGVRRAGTVAVAMVGLSLPFAAVAFELDGVLLGAGDFGYLRRAMILALVAFVPGAALTLLFPAVGVLGVWAALIFWLAARGGLLALRWRSGRWTAGRYHPD